MHYQIEYENNPNHIDIQRLNAGIAENTQQKRNFTPINPVAFFIRDENHQIVGGCADCLLYGSLRQKTHLVFSFILLRRDHFS